MEALKVYPGMPQEIVTIRGKEVRLEDDIYRDYVVASGRGMKEALGRIIQRPAYMSSTPERKLRRVEGIIKRVRARELGNAKRRQIRRGL